FVLFEHVGVSDIEYDPDSLLAEGGFTPQSVLAFEGEKLKPLHDFGRGLSSADEGEFRVAADEIEVDPAESRHRNVVLFERDPLIRVAVKRIFAPRQIQLGQFGSIESARETITEFFRSTAFFITFLEVTEDSPSLMH